MTLLEKTKINLGQRASSFSKNVRKKTLNKPHSWKQAPKTPWNSDEKAASIKTLSKFFSLNRLPGKAETEKVKRSEPALQKRPWQQIMFFIKNSKDSQKRKMGVLRNFFPQKSAFFQKKIFFFFLFFCAI